MKVPSTKAMRNVPTHGPGTSAFYKGSPCKILSIGGGKAKILVNGQVKQVLYTSIDDEMYGTGTGLPINESLKAIDGMDLEKYISSIKGVLGSSNLKAQEAARIVKYFGSTIDVVDITVNDKNFSKVLAEVKKGKLIESVPAPYINVTADIYQINTMYYVHIYGDLITERVIFSKPIVIRFTPFIAELWKNYSTTYKLVTGLLAGEKDLVSIFARKEIMTSGAEEINYSVFGKTVHKLLYWDKEKIVKIIFPDKSGLYVASKKTFAPYLNEAITIHKDYRYAFSFDELDLSKKQQIFIKRFLKDKVYQIPYEDENGDEPKEFTAIEKRIKNLEPIDYILDNGDYFEAFVLKNGTNIIKSSSSYGENCFYINPTTSINESENQEAYQTFFKQKLNDYGVESPAELTSNEKSKFFAEIKKEWNENKKS